MNSPQTTQKPLRVWPGVALAVVQALAWFAVPRLLPEQGFAGFMLALAAGLLILLWWLFASRAAWMERLGYFLLMIAAIAATSRVIHVSVAQTSMGMMFYFLAAMLTPFVFALTVAVSRGWAQRPRRAAMAASILLACGVFTLVRNEGVSGAGFQFKWRWSPTPEERLLAQGGDRPVMPPLPVAAPATPAAEPPAGRVEMKSDKAPALKAAPPAAPPAPLTVKWPGFRGPHRDDVVTGVQIQTDWKAAPPVELWRHAVGPGWSSFAVRGDLVYTQEQRGEAEVVSCYNLKTGKPVWEHRDAVRFWEANAGAGPRGTPTLSGNRAYAFGATGLLNVLDADTGAKLWSHDVAKDAEAKTPYWGFSSSPLVVGDQVVVAAAGRLVAYDIATGELRWMGPKGGSGYSSPQLVTIAGVEQILVLNGDGIISLSPADGTLLWENKWPGGTTILQPVQTPDGDLLYSISDMSGGVGVRRIAVTHDSSGWSIKERWTTRGLKPYYSGYVVHKGHAYGFDGSILACIDLADGARKWKGGRYGAGQLLLLADQDVLLVLSEEGELALVSATPGEFKELAKFPAIEGKTWNHPVVVGDILLVRNDREMAAFRLPLASGAKSASVTK